MCGMSYVCWREQSVFMANLPQRCPSCYIDPCIQLHQSPYRPRAHDWDIWNCFWYVMEIEKKEMKNSRWGSPAIFTKSSWIYLHAVKCQPKAQKCNGATPSVTQIVWLAVDQKLVGNHTPGCKRWSIHRHYSMSIMCIWVVAYNYWV